jgi:hypothetical protein
MPSASRTVPTAHGLCYPAKQKHVNHKTQVSCKGSCCGKHCLMIQAASMAAGTYAPLPRHTSLDHPMIVGMLLIQHAILLDATRKLTYCSLVETPLHESYHQPLNLCMAHISMSHTAWHLVGCPADTSTPVKYCQYCTQSMHLSLPLCSSSSVASCSWLLELVTACCEVLPTLPEPGPALCACRHAVSAAGQ